MATTTKFLTRKIDFSGNKLAFTFDGKPSQMFNPDSLPNSIRSKLVLWGLNEKLGNASANLAKNRETDKAVAVTNRLWEALCAGFMAAALFCFLSWRCCCYPWRFPKHVFIRLCCSRCCYR